MSNNYNSEFTVLLIAKRNTIQRMIVDRTIIIVTTWNKKNIVGITTRFHHLFWSSSIMVVIFTIIFCANFAVHQPFACTSGLFVDVLIMCIWFFLSNVGQFKMYFWTYQRKLWTQHQHNLLLYVYGRSN